MGKVFSLTDAVRTHVTDGALAFVGGFGQGVPFALGREIIRQGISDLTLCRTGADILFDLLVAAGAVKSLVVGWFGNPGIGISHVCREALRKEVLTLHETSNFGLLLRLQAAALGVPFLPTRTLKGGDLPAIAGVRQVVCPFTGEVLTAVAALAPDVALIHAQRADRHGNVQMWGVTGDTLTGARAARKVICTVEQIVDESVVLQSPQLTVLPAHVVTAVVEAPWGAWPSYVQDFYDRDDLYYRDFDRLSRDAIEVHATLAEIRANEGGPAPSRQAHLAWTSSHP
jgi:glutaconate CoA-transferase, subunit A